MTVLLPSTAEKDLAKYALALQQLAAGRSNATGTVTLATGATSTVVSAVNCSPQSAVFLFPKTADGALSVGPTFSVKKQIFTASGTYTPSAGMAYCVIECVGGGGAGGGSAGASTFFLGAGGGGGGNYSRLLASAADIGASKAVTIGAGGTAGTAGANAGNAGGDTSLGTLCIGKGGSGGGRVNSVFSPSPGAGGVAGTGDFTIPGKSGEGGYYLSAGATGIAPSVFGGSGGGNPLGEGGVSSTAAASSSVSGSAGKNYGGGGSGGASATAASNTTGGVGAPGVAIITEYCFAASATTFVSSVGKQTFTISHDNDAIADRTFFYVCLG